MWWLCWCSSEMVPILSLAQMHQRIFKFSAWYWIKTLSLYQQKRKCILLMLSLGFCFSVDWGENLIWNLLFAVLHFTQLSFLNCLELKIFPTSVMSTHRWGNRSTSLCLVLCILLETTMYVHLFLPNHVIEMDEVGYLSGKSPFLPHAYSPMQLQMTYCRRFYCKKGPIGLMLLSGLWSRNTVPYLPSCLFKAVIEIVTWISS